jgi:orotidine-5'-phosphate decarboxylase
MAEVILALDRPSATEALELVDRLGPRAGFYKVGLELFTGAGPRIVEELRSREKRVFLDLKLHDIPNTVAGAVRAAAEAGVDLLTVHSAGGAGMLRAAVEAASGRLRLLGVTVLTSTTLSDLGEVWGRIPDSVEDEVVRLARLARASGLDGIVASAREAERVRAELGSECLIVTPGIRLAGGDAHDQERVATPRAAAEAGADYLVVGRAVTGAADPVLALEQVIADLDGAASTRAAS